MRINIHDPNPGTWFYFDEENPDEGRIKLRVLTAGVLADIKDKTTKVEAEYRNDRRFEYEVVDKIQRDNLMRDYCIVKWENIIDEKGNPIECNKENKIKLMNEHIGFGMFVNRSLETLNKQQGIIDEDSEKN